MTVYVAIIWHTPWVAHGYELAADRAWRDRSAAETWCAEMNEKAGITPLADDLRGGAYYANQGEYEVVDLEVVE